MASVQSAGCEALRADQTVDTPHPHIVPGAKCPEQRLTHQRHALWRLVE
jgi:hypothetical protein